MDHPHIAKVLDAGSTDSGHPYFAMELVKGIPITEYCRLHKLTTRERLELVVNVCDAVQHAHQKGIIHRDLKPNNLLVELHDVKASPKVVDFGIAKSIGQRLTDRTLFTRFNQMLGTPLYMSPEQSQLNGLDVDTRSDVYSLGVLLYELLTGTTPFGSQGSDRDSFEELRSRILSEEPPRPSQRISTLKAEAFSTLTSSQQIDARKLKQTCSERARLGCHEGIGEGSNPTVSVSVRICRRHPEVLERRASFSLPAKNLVPILEICPSQSGSANNEWAGGRGIDYRYRS